jgi:PAS domain S-box-containing protein
MSAAFLASPASRWLEENGPRELELLFRAIVYHPLTPIVIADVERTSREVSVGVGKLLGLPRENIIGRKLDDFVAPSVKPRVSDLWQAFLEEGEWKAPLSLKGPDGRPLEIEVKARTNVLPARHLVALGHGPIPAWVQDYAVFLMDVEGVVVAWYAGAERIFGYTRAEAVGKNVSFLYSNEDLLIAKVQSELKRAAAAAHFGNEGWRLRKDGSRFWANSITMALKDQFGELQGFARVVRDFGERHERDQKLRRERPPMRSVSPESTIAGVVSGEFDQVTEVNDAFLEMSGYSREELIAGTPHWLDLTAPESRVLDEIAHEEGLLFGACTPFEKEFLRKDGTRVLTLAVTAVLKLSPFRWITFVQDLRERDHLETFEEDDSIPQDFDEMVGASAALRRVQRLIEVVAPTDANVLILGETGTGKELVARSVHRLSPRRNLPFVVLNCAAIPTGLLESELFGYERGAFTGALSQKIGRFEMAHRGTLFLDEVGDIALDLQPKLLRALQEKSFERLGGTKTIPIDVRLVAATNRDLTQMMVDKLFRSDLYYRLKVFPITTTPLREHPEDIPILARHFAKVYAAKMGREIDKIPPETMRVLSDWAWPGNVRELENFIERSVILSRGPTLRAPLAEIREASSKAAGSDSLEHVERQHILRVLQECGGVVTTAATRLGMHRTTLNAMMRRLGISRKDV